MAENWRKKNQASDVVSALYNPEQMKQKKKKTEALKKLLE